MKNFAKVLKIIFRIMLAIIIMVSWWWSPRSFYLLFYSQYPSDDPLVAISCGICTLIAAISLVCLWFWAEDHGR